MFAHIIEKPNSRVWVGRVEYGDDLLDAVTEFAKEKNIKFGKISAIGALTTAHLSFFNPATKHYDEYDVPNAPLELLSAEGNISLVDGAPFVHLHVTTSDAAGAVSGGHLMRGTICYNVELFIEEIDYEISREPDDVTGLKVWR